MHKEKVRIAGHMRRMRVCDQCAMIATDETAGLLEEDLNTHNHVSTTLYEAMHEKDQEIDSFKALLKLLVPDADEGMAIDELLAKLRTDAEASREASAAARQRIASTQKASEELQARLNEQRATAEEVMQKRQAIAAQLSTIPDVQGEVADLENKEAALTKKARGLSARIEKLQGQHARAYTAGNTSVGSQARTVSTTSTVAPSAREYWRDASTSPDVDRSGAASLPGEPTQTRCCCCCRRRRRANGPDSLAEALNP